jgi:hypothetical protein
VKIIHPKHSTGWPKPNSGWKHFQPATERLKIDGENGRAAAVHKAQDPHQLAPQLTIMFCRWAADFDFAGKPAMPP